MPECAFWFDDEFTDDLPADSSKWLLAITSMLNILDGCGGTGAAGEPMEASFRDVLDALSQVLPDDQFGLLAGPRELVHLIWPPVTESPL
jgi:hypothetical protein